MPDEDELFERPELEGPLGEHADPYEAAKQMEIEPAEIPPLPTDLDTPLAPEISDDHKPVFILSDIHIGSNAQFRISPKHVIDKARSNWFPQPEPRRLLVWLHWVTRVAQQIAPNRPYDVVLVGDFLDIWQADRPPGLRDNYILRIGDILGTNASFFKGFTAWLATNPRAHFHYLIGNHDDPFYRGDATEDDLFGLGLVSNATYGKSKYDFMRLRAQFLSYLDDLAGKRLGNISIAKRYLNNTFRLYCEHGHKNDDHNLRGSNYWGHNGPPPGQKVVETAMNVITEMPGPGGSYPFQGFASMGAKSMNQIVTCINDLGQITPELRDAIEEFRQNFASALGAEYWIANEVLPENLTDWIAERKTDPKKTNDSNYDYIKRKLISEGGGFQIAVMGHTHLFDWRESQDEIYANSDSWIPKYTVRERQIGNQKICELVEATGPKHPFLIARWKPLQTGGGATNIRGKVELIYYTFTPSLSELERGEVNVRA
jgi:UDP-2,3-diacylglucosamine pyrophosphatase LpxH